MTKGPDGATAGCQTYSPGFGVQRSGTTASATTEAAARTAKATARMNGGRRSVMRLILLSAPGRDLTHVNSTSACPI